AKFTSNTQSEVYAQTYDAAGNRLGGETLISTDDGPLNVMPRVSALKDGGYVVSWTQMTSGNYYDYNRFNNPDVKSVIVNADGSIRGSGDTNTYSPTATYQKTGVGTTLTGNDQVNTLDGRDGASVFNAGAG